jgi:anti-sigma factor RsiW
MRCDWVEERLNEYLEAELGPLDRSAVDEHLAACESCARELEALKEIRQLLDDDGYRAPSSFFWTRFNAELMEKVGQRGQRAGAVSMWPELWPKLAPAVVALLFFAVGLWMGLMPFIGMDRGGEGGPSLAELRQTAGEPLISESSKLLAEARGVSPSVSYAADTLWLDSFTPAETEPGTVFTSDEARRMLEMQRLLESRLLRD